MLASFTPRKLLSAALVAFPAATRAAILTLPISLVLLAALRLSYQDERPKVFLLGDSFIGNYRLAPGERMQDLLEQQDPQLHVENWAEPGATPLDLFLQYSRGTLVAGRPEAVVIGLSPSVFESDSPPISDDAGDDSPHRLDEDGANLRWIPWNKTGWNFFTHLTPRERNVAVVQQASLLLFSAADVGRALWVRFVQWPWERAQMQAAAADRRVRIERHALRSGTDLEHVQIREDAGFAAQPRARQARVTLQALRQEGVRTLVLILPYGNPELLRRTHSPAALAKRDLLIERVRTWLTSQGVAYLDFNVPKELEHFPDTAWDDRCHLKSPAAVAYIAQRIDEALRQRDSSRHDLALRGDPVR